MLEVSPKRYRCFQYGIPIYSSSALDFVQLLPEVIVQRDTYGFINIRSSLYCQNKPGKVIVCDYLCVWFFFPYMKAWPRLCVLISATITSKVVACYRKPCRVALRHQRSSSTRRQCGWGTPFPCTLRPQSHPSLASYSVRGTKDLVLLVETHQHPLAIPHPAGLLVNVMTTLRLSDVREHGQWYVSHR